MSSETVNRGGMKEFLKRLAIVSTRNQNHKTEKQILKEKVRKLKDSSLGKKTKNKILGKFSDIEDKLSAILTQEQEIIEKEHLQDKAYNNLMREINKHNKQIESIDEEVAEMKTKVKKTKKKTTKKKKSSKNPYAEKLKVLEKTYNKLKRSKKYPKKELTKIKYQIDKLKIKAATSEF